MKKFLLIVLTLAVIFAFAACAADEPTNPDDEAEGEGGTYELAMITDAGTIDDKSFNYGALQGLKQYAEENGITYKYYQPAEVSDAAYLDSIALAIEGGAQLIVCPGYLFEPAVYEAQYLYPDIKFIILDGEPHTADYATFAIEDNVNAIYFAEQEAGFLAGYAAVKEGFTKLGFMGGMAVPAVVRYGYGYIAGAQYAAEELGITGIEIMYHYTGDFKATPETQTLAGSWYNAGTEVIFGCGGAVGNSVMAAAEPVGAYVIGVDLDQSGESPTVITSALKNLTPAVYMSVKAYYDGEFHGGVIDRLSAVNDAVGLPMATSKFTTFTQEDYDAIYSKLLAGEIAIPVDTDFTSAAELANAAVSVTVVE
jgi:basic membrane protein A and related proteins